MISLCFLVVGFILGLYGHFLKDLYSKLPEPEKPTVGASPGLYGQVNEYAANQDGEIGISEPLTPAQLEWKQAEELKRLNNA